MCPRSKVHLVSADQTPAPKSGPSRKSTRLKWRLVLSVEQTPHCNSFLTFEACVGYTLRLHDGKLGQNSIYLHVIRRISLRDYSPPTNIMILSADRCSFVVRQCLLYRVSHFLQSLPQSTSLAAFTTVFISCFSCCPTNSQLLKHLLFFPPTIYNPQNQVFTTIVAFVYSSSWPFSKLRNI